MAVQFDRFTVKAQEAVQRAVSQAEERGHQELKPLHLLYSLLTEEQGVMRPVLQKIGTNINQLQSLVESELDRIPKVSGAGFQVGMGSACQRIFEAAQDAARQLKDEYVSTEHLLLGLTRVDDQAKRLLEMNAVESDDILTALKSIRGGQRVTDQTPEDKYQA